jgi:hypothetical protein
MIKLKSKVMQSAIILSVFNIRFVQLVLIELLIVYFLLSQSAQNVLTMRVRQIQMPLNVE